MKKKKCLLLLAGGLVAALAVGLVAAQDKLPVPHQAIPGPPNREADRQAIRQLSAAFVRALEKGDAKAVAALWTEEGEYIADDGTTIHGRPALEEAYAAFLRQSHGLKVEGRIDSIRFVSRDSAVEEGHVKTSKGNAEQPTTAHYRLFLTREDGRWRLAMLQEWLHEPASLETLGWLIGSWTAKAGATEVRTTYTWNDRKTFILVRFAIREADHATTGTQVIGEDPRTGQVRSWLFANDGGFGEAAWSWDGKRWLLEASGVEADGSQMTAQNILTPLDQDSFTWQSTDRKVDGKEVAAIPPIKVTRAP